MQNHLRKFSAILTSAVLLALPLAAQQQQAPDPNAQDIPQNQKLTKEQKKN